ncbi:hypothetical protein ACQPZF_13855 [Actinosynnema sp. CS-041913]|uniref:hypothetical protein n=1 Tax=Actinosynnema sp. CS-041913 TaxID=3239917 RepID=UPI003D8E3AF2
MADGNAAGLCDHCHQEQRKGLHRPPTLLRHEFFETEEFCAAFESQHIGHVIKAYRHHSHWLKLYGRTINQDTVGRWLGLTQAQVSRPENGRPEQNLDRLRSYAEKLRLPRHMLWFDFPGHRRLSIEGASDLPGDTEIGDPIDSPFFVSLEAAALDLSALSDARNHFEMMYRNLGGPMTQDRLTRFLTEHVSPLLAQSHSQSQGNRRQLYRATGGLVALAGVCAYDGEHHGVAQRHFRKALTLAELASDAGFRAYVLALMANQGIALGASRQAISLTELALNADCRLPGALQADLYGMAAKAHAQLKDSTGTYRSMSLAEACATRVSAGSTPAEIGYVQHGLTEAHFVDALTELGDLTPAQRYADRLFTIPAHARGRVNRLASIVTLELRLGAVDRASILTIKMVDSAKGMESRRLNARFRTIRSALANLSSDTTSEATEKIDRFLTISPW